MVFFKFLYEYLDSLKWVLLIASFIYFFRKELKGILNRPFSVSHNGTKVDFPLALQQIEDKSNENNNLPMITDEEIKVMTSNLEKKDSEIKDKDQRIFQLTLEKHFEYTYRLIFRSQIQLMQNLQVITDGFSTIQLENYFVNIKNSFIALNSWDLNLYLKFLYDQNLIEKDTITGKVKITSVGDLFLKYLVVSGYNFNTEKGL